MEYRGIFMGVWACAIAIPLLAAPAPVGLPKPFATSDRCVACHNGLTAPDGEDVSFGKSWKASMMANAARDPYWTASVRRETLDHPTASTAIEHECATCHMPMARYVAQLLGREQPVLGHEEPLADDGVSCTTCHRISWRELGEESTFSGRLSVESRGMRKIYGPYPISGGRTRIMSSASGFLPVKAGHIGSAELCAACHTLITHSLGPDGRVTGELPEQVPYLEWKHGAYAGVRDCVSCHMPEVDEPVAIASVLGEPREEVSRHVFRGGNFLVPRILAAHGDTLKTVASSKQLEATSKATLAHLQEEAASISVEKPRIAGSSLTFEVAVENYAGHKLPTAYPSRRAWLHLTVEDRGGKVVFESGALRHDGSIVGNDNDDDASRFEPHYREIERAEQVQIYEPVLAGPDGTVTTGLLTAVRYIKDNRLLPEGFDKSNAEERIAVRGDARDDADFRDGGDRVKFRLDLAEGRPPFEIHAELKYQPIGFRWANNLGGHHSAETERFVRYYGEVADRSAALLAQDSATVNSLERIEE